MLPTVSIVSDLHSKYAIIEQFKSICRVAIIFKLLNLPRTESQRPELKTIVLKTVSVQAQGS